MSVTLRDRWVRSRFKVWLTHCLETHEGITINSLSKQLAGETLGDYRGTLRAYCRGTTTVSPERAFDIGEAIGEIAPGGPVNGLVAVAVAGYYEEFLAFLEAFYSIPFDEHDIGSQLTALNVPLFAEFEVARLSGNLGSVAEAAQKVMGVHGKRWIRDTHRAVLSAYRFLTRANAAQYVLRKTGEEPFPTKPAWRSRWDPPDALPGDESSDDRRTLVRLARLSASSAGDLESDRLAAVLLDFVWQWMHLAAPVERQRDYEVMNVLRRLFDVNAARRYRKRNIEHYEFASLGGSITALIPKRNQRVLALAPEERLEDLKRFADELRAHVLEYLRALNRLTTREEPMATWVKARREAYQKTLLLEPRPEISQLLSHGMTNAVRDSIDAKHTSA